MLQAFTIIYYYSAPNPTLIHSSQGTRAESGLSLSRGDSTQCIVQGVKGVQLGASNYLSSVGVSSALLNLSPHPYVPITFGKCYIEPLELNSSALASWSPSVVWE